MSDQIRVPDSVSEAVRESLLTSEALAFVQHLHRVFNPERRKLLQMRANCQKRINEGLKPDFLDETKDIRGGEWCVATSPPDLTDRRVEITGPTDRKMMINALNSGAKVFMADLEDSLAPSWENIVEGQLNLQRAVRKTIDFTANNGKKYALNPSHATLVVRPRGWHLEDRHVTIGDGEEYISASLLDFGLYFFHNAKALIAQESGPYFYLPKLEHHLEARLWNDVFIESQKYLGLEQGTIRATVLIETITAAFQMEEILFELKEHSAGLNAGRWDYIFSVIKKFQNQSEFTLPDRKHITMTVPFMKAYTELLVQSCHRHQAHAIGGMSAFIPNRKLKEINDQAINAVRDDKQREARDGFDGTWVAHPDLVPVAKEAFDKVLGTQMHQKHILRQELKVTQKDLLPSPNTRPEVSEAGVKTNIQVAIHYIAKWLDGLGAVAINHLMEDAATAEISRAQLWQWIHHRVLMTDGRKITKELYLSLKEDVMNTLRTQDDATVELAAETLDQIVLSENFQEFLTIPAYQLLTKNSGLVLRSIPKN